MTAQSVDTIGRSPAFVFAGDETDGQKTGFQLMDGALVEQKTIDAVKQWLRLMLRQPKGKIPIYHMQGETEPGIDRSLLVRGLSLGVVYSELQRNVTETVQFCPAIRSVDDFVFTRLRRGLEVAFTVHLYTEETLQMEMEVSSNGDISI